jgi:hypothetical protein
MPAESVPPGAEAAEATAAVVPAAALITGAGPGNGGEIAGRAVRLLGQVAAIARNLGDDAAAALAEAQAREDAAHAARVAVVGEKKRGKSSLINALLRRPGLLPVDVDIATSVHISVYAADRDQAWVIDEDGPAGREIELARIGEYAALDPDNLEMRHPGVREVAVGLPDPLLRAGLALVDTPGVGGLASGHAALTLAALAQADALLFVVNGGSELTASECAFLAQATERVATVVFVLTQTDKYPRWRDVLARNQTLIVEHARQFADAPWLAVSSRMRLDAVRADEAGDAARARELDQRSGFPALVEMLEERITGRAGELSAVNAAWVARRVISTLITGQEQRLRSLTQDPGLAAALAAQRALLNDCRRADAVWRRTLADRFAGLNRDLWQLYQRRLADLQVTADRWIADVGTATVTQIAHDLDAGVQALWADLESGARQGAAGIAADIAAQLNAGGIGALAMDMPAPGELRQLPAMQLTEETAKAGAVGMLARHYQGVAMTVFAGHIVLAAVNPLLLLPVGVFLGRVLYEDSKAKEDTARLRADVQRHVRAVITRVGVEVPRALQDGLETLRAGIENVITARMNVRAGELESAIAKGKRDLQASEEELAPQRAATERALHQLRGLLGQAGQLSGGAAVTARPASGG